MSASREARRHPSFSKQVFVPLTLFVVPLGSPARAGWMTLPLVQSRLAGFSRDDGVSDIERNTTERSGG
jgi:hypothetical protein